MLGGMALGFFSFKTKICPASLSLIKDGFHYFGTSTLWKESLSSDGHQFHQYQQNKQSLLIFTELTEHKKKTMTYDVGDPGPVLGWAQKCGRVKPVIISHICISHKNFQGLWFVTFRMIFSIHWSMFIVETMDVLRPQMIRIGDRCYRKNPTLHRDITADELDEFDGMS